MKYLFIYLIISAVWVFSIDCTSPVKCTGECDRSKCASTEDCRCGTHLDECDCCSFCYICPNEDCSIIANERCTAGYECTHPEGVTGPDVLNFPGKCLKAEDL